MNKGAITGGAVVLAIAAFVAGAFLGPKIPFVADATVTSTSQTQAGPGAMNGGPMAQLSDEERAKIEGMTEEERREYLQEQMGAGAPSGAQGAGALSGRGGMTVEGEVLEVADDSVTVGTTNGGSQTIYVNDATVIAYTQGTEASALAAGDSVIVTAQPQTDNVVTATTVIVK